MKYKNWEFKTIKMFSLILLIVASSARSMAQEPFPSRPINVIVGATPGGSTDSGVRIVAGQVSNELGVSLVIINKPGGGGLVGSEFVRQSKPDGYTLFGASFGVVTIPILDPKCPYTINDFDPICLHDNQANVVVVKAESPFKTIREVFDFARKNPGKLSYGSAG